MEEHAVHIQYLNNHFSNQLIKGIQIEEQSSVNHYPNTHTFCESLILPLSKRLHCMLNNSPFHLTNRCLFAGWSTQQPNTYSNWSYGSSCPVNKEHKNKLRGMYSTKGRWEEKQTYGWKHRTEDCKCMHSEEGRPWSSWGQLVALHWDSCTDCRAQVKRARTYLLRFCDAHGIKLVQERTVSLYLTKNFMLILFNFSIYGSKVITSLRHLKNKPRESQLIEQSSV